MASSQRNHVVKEDALALVKHHKPLEGYVHIFETLAECRSGMVGWFVLICIAVRRIAQAALDFGGLVGD